MIEVKELKSYMNKLVMGILAHVDAGKTTLSESMLYLSGKIRTLGRVDKKDAYLDTYDLERERGITIFSKQAMFEAGNTQITLLDTPGHVDFSAEMERTLQVLDYAILVISGADGVQGHTQTLWRLLKRYEIPVFIFVNKMDQKGTNRESLIKELKTSLSDGCIEFGQGKSEDFYDQLAMSDEGLMEAYLERGHLEAGQIAKGIKERKVFPCFFGSALKLEGVELFIENIIKYAKIPPYPKEFGARVFKIARDEQGNRLTYMKLTGGTLKVRDALKGQGWEEKVNQIRLYSGDKFEPVSEIEAGAICALTGLTQTRPGEGLGIEKTSVSPLLEPVLSYQIILPEDADPRVMLPKLHEIEEEQPELRIVWNEQLQEIQVQMMGEVQTEILQSVIRERFDTLVEFDAGSIVYKETISNKVEGVGHFEPLRHYAEVHLLMEPGALGSGLVFALDCSEDLLEKSWQRLILSHLKEKVHKGVLTGSAITDMKITLVAGRAHKQHTEGGDFREATYRAVRQGLKQARSILLEPYYEFSLELPSSMVGRAMTDIEQMQGTYKILATDEEISTLVGSAPVVNMRNYHQEVIAYTKGHGRLFVNLKGYAPCQNAEEIIEEIGYDSERDFDNPTGSIFCTKGAGFSVSWDEVENYMHLGRSFDPQESLGEEDHVRVVNQNTMSENEINEILSRHVSPNKGKTTPWKKPKVTRGSHYKSPTQTSQPKESGEKYLLVDGYNIIFSWPELKEMAEDNIDGARIKLLDYLSNYRGIKKHHIIVVFDAYRVKGQRAEIMDYHNIHVVYTQEAQTADHYIERFVYEHHGKYHITVATSDALEQVIIRGKASALLSARELREDVEKAHERMMQAYAANKVVDRNYLMDTLPLETKQRIEAFLTKENK